MGWGEEKPLPPKIGIATLQCNCQSKECSPSKARTVFTGGSQPSGMSNDVSTRDDDFDVPLFPDACHYTPTPRPWRDMYTDPGRMLRSSSGIREEEIEDSKLILLWRQFPELLSGWPGLLLRHLPVKTIMALSRCSKKLRHLCQDPTVLPALTLFFAGCRMMDSRNHAVPGMEAVVRLGLARLQKIRAQQVQHVLALHVHPPTEGQIRWSLHCQVRASPSQLFDSRLMFLPRIPMNLAFNVPRRWSTMRYGTDEGHGSKEAGKNFYRPVIITCMYRVIYFVDGQRFIMITTNTDSLQPDQVISCLLLLLLLLLCLPSRSWSTPCLFCSPPLPPLMLFLAFITLSHRCCCELVAKPK
eukprot:1515896-Rhodomonas_salina.1